MIATTILDCIGNTPLVEMPNLSPSPALRFFAKLEGQNPTGSVKDRIAQAADRSIAAALPAFLADMPDRYFLGTAEDRILHHLRMVSALDGARSLTEVRHYPERDFSEFTVLTRDRPGLFSMITGVLLANGMNILGASINTRATMDVAGDGLLEITRAIKWCSG